MARKTKQERIICINELRSLVESGEILNYTERDLEKKLKWTRKSLRKHLVDIKSEIGNRSIKVITLNFVEIMDTMMDDVKLLWLKAREQGDEKKIIFYTNQMFKSWERFADLLERFGIKEKVPEKHEIKAGIVHINIEKESKNILSELNG